MKCCSILFNTVDVYDFLDLFGVSSRLTLMSTHLKAFVASNRVCGQFESRLETEHPPACLALVGFGDRFSGSCHPSCTPVIQRVSLV